MLAALPPFLLYLRTMAPTVYGLDSAELATGAYLLGIVHAPGAPTFLLLGHLFTWLPWGDVGYRVNLVSAVSAALALGFLCAALRRLGVSRATRVAGCWFLATTWFYWTAALAAELYAPHVCFVAALLWLALRFHQLGRRRDLFAFCLVFGVALGNHLSMAFLLPGFQALLITGRRDVLRAPALLAGTVLFATLGASVYVYLPLRAAAGVEMNYALEMGIDVRTLDGFAWMVSGRMFEDQLFAIPPARLPPEVGWFVYRLWSNFLGLASLLALAGLAAGLRRQRIESVALILLLVGHLAFVLPCDVADKETMLLPAMLVWGVWCTLGADFLARHPRLPLLHGGGGSAALLLAALACGNLVINFARADVSADTSARARGDEVFAALPPGALYLADWADASVLEYLQRVEGQRPDVTVANSFLVRGEARRNLLDSRVTAAGDVYLGPATGWTPEIAAGESNAACGCVRAVRLRAAARRSGFWLDPGRRVP